MGGINKPTYGESYRYESQTHGNNSFFTLAFLCVTSTGLIRIMVHCKQLPRLHFLLPILTVFSCDFSFSRKVGVLLFFIFHKFLSNTLFPPDHFSFIHFALINGFFFRLSLNFQPASLTNSALVSFFVYNSFYFNLFLIYIDYLSIFIAHVCAGVWVKVGVCICVYV